MESVNFFPIFSLVVGVMSIIVGVASVILAILAISISRSSERESRANFEKTQALMHDYDTKNREVVAEIDKRAAVIEKTVAESHQQLLNTVTDLAVPPKAGFEERFGEQLLQILLQDPQKGSEVIQKLQPLVEMADKHRSQEEQK